MESVVGTSENQNVTGDLDILDDLTIVGNGPENTIVQAGTTNLNGIDRVFDIRSNYTVVMESLTVRFGRVNDNGAGIYNNSGNLTMTEAEINENSGNFGGAFFNYQGTITIERSTVADNSAVNNSGGVDNSAFSSGATLNVYNSTFSGNSAGYAGGAILAYTGGGGAATVNLVNATIHNNSASVGALTAWDNGNTAVINMENSLVADQTGVTADCGAITGGTFVSNDHNLDSDGTCNLVQANDIPSGTANLGPLQDNGGHTQTHALLTSSQAINSGNNTTCAAAPINNVDQRGVARPQNSTCDMGAYELVTAVTPGAAGGLGPGGVGHTDGSSILELWLRADKGVFSDTNCTTAATSGGSVGCWQDQSGNNLNVTRDTVAQRPGYQTAVVNNQPALTFSGTQFLERAYNSGFHPTNFTLYAMSNSAGGTDYRTPVGNRNFTNCGYNLYAGQTNQWEYWPNGGGGWTQLNGAPVILNQWIFLTATYDSVNRNRFYANGSLIDTDPFVYVSCATHGSTPAFVIGNIQVSGPFPFIGSQSEFILYSLELPAVERLLVDNYLSSKYDHTIPLANDLYDGDTVGNGDFDLDVAGVGRFSGNQHTQSHAAGMIVVDNSFLNDDGDWLLFGHSTPNNTHSPADLPTTGDWATAPNPLRWARHFYIDVTDGAGTTGGTVDIIFDFSEGNMSPNSCCAPDGDISNYRLLKRTGTTGQFTDIATATAVVGDQVYFQGVDVALLGSNFTLGSLDSVQSPTAVTLQSTNTSTPQQLILPLVILLLVAVTGLGWAVRYVRIPSNG